MRYGLLLCGLCVCVMGAPTKTDEPIKMQFAWYRLVWVQGTMKVHIGATCQIRLNSRARRQCSLILINLVPLLLHDIGDSIVKPDEWLIKLWQFYLSSGVLH